MQLIEQTKEEIKKQTQVVRTELDTFLAKISVYTHHPDDQKQNVVIQTSAQAASTVTAAAETTPSANTTRTATTTAT